MSQKGKGKERYVVFCALTRLQIYLAFFHSLSKVNYFSLKTIPSPLDLAGGFASIIISWIDRIRPSYFRLRGKSIFLYEKSISRHFSDDQIVLLLRGYTTGNS